MLHLYCALLSILGASAIWIIFGSKPKERFPQPQDKLHKAKELARR